MATFVLGPDWEDDEWPENVTVYHLGNTKPKRYLPERKCRMEYHYSDAGGCAKTCSVCGKDAYPFKSDFTNCPHCGARIIKEEWRDR